MKKTVYICDGCGKQDDEVTRYKTRRSSWGYSSYREQEKVAPEGWSRVTVNRKGADICSPDCAGAAIDNITKAAEEAAEKKAKAEKEKIAKAAQKARDAQAKRAKVKASA